MTDLCAALRLPQPTVSHHLGLMRRSGVLDCRRDGKQIYYCRGQTVALDADGTISLKARGVSIHIEPAAKGVEDAEATRSAAAAAAQQGLASPVDEPESVGAVACVYVLS